MHVSFIEGTLFGVGVKCKYDTDHVLGVHQYKTSWITWGSPESAYWIGLKYVMYPWDPLA